MSAPQDRELKVTYGYDDVSANTRSRFYKHPELEGCRRIRLQRANDSLHDLELRINTRTDSAHVDLNDGILRAVSVSCSPARIKVERIYHVYVLFAGDACFDVTEQAAVKLHDWLADVLAAPAAVAAEDEA